MKTRKPVRLQGFDYSREGVYFVTICSKDRECIFGHPDVGAPLACARTLGIDARTIEIELTQIGQIIEKQWNDIPNQFKTVDIDEFVSHPWHLDYQKSGRGKRGPYPFPHYSFIQIEMYNKISTTHQ